MPPSVRFRGRETSCASSAATTPPASRAIRAGTSIRRTGARLRPRGRRRQERNPVFPEHADPVVALAVLPPTTSASPLAGADHRDQQRQRRRRVDAVLLEHRPDMMRRADTASLRAKQLARGAPSCATWGDYQRAVGGRSHARRPALRQRGRATPYSVTHNHNLGNGFTGNLNLRAFPTTRTSPTCHRGRR